MLVALPLRSPDTFPSAPLVGLVVKASTPREEDPLLDSRLPQDFFGVESYQ